MTCVSSNGMTPPGSNVTILTCMSWRRSAGSTKRVVAQRPCVSGIGLWMQARTWPRRCHLAAIVGPIAVATVDWASRSNRSEAVY